ncbi:MAG: AI-2E family transporter [Chloroflexi bacterium]|uniref:AI-2E family transporter n=1 Tax=Candidatus Chlorohelix allophototropha TaxID=3003348 RepID=A0A8T7LWN7_9CHLR|nr:AI-2E family transporter [Chloroflexota bacterium]WJW66511.1 AI-2E family transporter [Chloroflexota bacterium L227-S17]
MQNNTEKLPSVQELKFSPTMKRLIVFIVVGLLVAFFLKIGEILPPFIWALVTAFIFNDPIKYLTWRTGKPRWVWSAVLYLIFFVVLVLVIAWLVPAVRQEAKILSEDVPKIQQSVKDNLGANPTVNIAGIEVQSDTVISAVDGVVNRLPEIAQEIGPKLLSGTFRFLIDFLLYLIATFYFLLMGARPLLHFLDTLPLMARNEMLDLFERADRVLGAYIKAQFFLVLIMSVSSFIIMEILGIRYAILLAIMVGVLELIPFVGPYLAIGISCLVAYFQPHGANLSFGLDGVMLAIVVAIALFILRQIEDYLVIPNLVGKILELPPLLVIFSTIAGAALLGPMGLLLSVPVVAVLKIVIGYLYYKLVDADRQKIILKPGTDSDELLETLDRYESGSRLLLVGAKSEVLRKPEVLTHIQQLRATRKLDVAFFVGEDEPTAHTLRGSGFSVVVQEQEHFFGNED